MSLDHVSLHFVQVMLDLLGMFVRSIFRVRIILVQYLITLQHRFIQIVDRSSRVPTISMTSNPRPNSQSRTILVQSMQFIISGINLRGELGVHMRRHHTITIFERRYSIIEPILFIITG
jgi:hypothetical protein